jgi:AcrR family transcriptional regulator
VTLARAPRGSGGSAVTEPLDRREVILSSAAEIFARKGLQATTVRGIADAVGVLSGSLYHHFPSKNTILNEILHRYLASIQDRYDSVLASGKSAPECLHDLVLASLQVAQEQPYATAIYQNEAQYLREQPEFRAVMAVAAEVQSTWLRIIEAGIADGSFRDDIPSGVFYRLIRDAVWLSVRWHRPGGRNSTTQLADQVTSLFLHGFAAPTVLTARPAARRKGSRPAVG